MAATFAFNQLEAEYMESIRRILTTKEVNVQRPYDEDFPDDFKLLNFLS